jgi:hypothetical protein
MSSLELAVDLDESKDYHGIAECVLRGQTDTLNADSVAEILIDGGNPHYPHYSVL